MTVSTLPVNLPDAPDAKLPATYENAQRALAECNSVDEAWTWQNKAAALAAYARMARDTALRDMALRIQSRAIRRAGELLRQTPSAQGANLTAAGRDGAVPISRGQAASEAGLSERQRKTATRLASIPADEFETAVEADSPPTMTELAARGTASRPTATPIAVAPADPATAARAQALLRDFAAFCAVTDPLRVARAAMDADLARGYVESIDRWLDQFVTSLRPEDAAA